MDCRGWLSFTFYTSYWLRYPFYKCLFLSSWLWNALWSLTPSHMWSGDGRGRTRAQEVWSHLETVLKKYTQIVSWTDEALLLYSSNTQNLQTMFSSQTGSCPKETVTDWVTPSQKLPTPCIGARQQSQEFGECSSGLSYIRIAIQNLGSPKRHYTS